MEALSVRLDQTSFPGLDLVVVNNAVIPVAGWGTRFLPASKGVPKELLPLIDKPVIQFAVEEAADSGIGQVVLVREIFQT